MRFDVCVRRGRMRFRASVAKSNYSTPQAALAHAVELRDRFLISAGPAGYRPAYRLAKVAKSNTGITGISDMVHWMRSKPKPCFRVHLPKGFRPVAKNFYYGSNGRSREAALALPMAYRRNVVERYIALHPQPMPECYRA